MHQHLNDLALHMEWADAVTLEGALRLPWAQYFEQRTPRSGARAGAA